MSAILLIKNLTAENLNTRNSQHKKTEEKLYEASQNIDDFNSNFKNYNQKIRFVDNQNNIRAEFMIAIADTTNKQRIGLMNLKQLPENLGMLFPQESPRKISMWMKNTIISLDMIFLDKNNKINYIAKNTTPFSTEIITSKEDSSAVLEVNAGIAEKLKLQIGDELLIIK